MSEGLALQSRGPSTDPFRASGLKLGRKWPKTGFGLHPGFPFFWPFWPHFLGEGGQIPFFGHFLTNLRPEARNGSVPGPRDCNYLSDPRNRNYKSLAIGNHNFEVASFSRRNRSKIAVSQSQKSHWAKKIAAIQNHTLVVATYSAGFPDPCGASETL